MTETYKEIWRETEKERHREKDMQRERNRLTASVRQRQGRHKNNGMHGGRNEEKINDEETASNNDVRTIHRQTHRLAQKGLKRSQQSDVDHIVR